MFNGGYTITACAGKTAYDSWGDANKVVRNMGRFGKPVDAYKCSACGQWHIGSPTHKKSKPMRRR